MIKCAKCGCELSDTALFCRNCGESVKDLDALSRTDTEKSKDNLLGLSVQLRELCDKMTAEYVDAVKTLELKEAALRENIKSLETRLSALEEDLANERADNARLTQELNDSSVVNNRLFSEKMKLEEELAALRSAADKTVMAMHETDSSQEPEAEEEYCCPQCGAAVAADAVFCGNCGSRLD